MSFNDSKGGDGLIDPVEFGAKVGKNLLSIHSNILLK